MTARVSPFIAAFAALVTGFASSAVAQTTQPTTAPAKPEPAGFFPDLLKSKTLTGDWGGVRTELEDVGIALHLYYNTQFQQNIHGGLSTDDAHALSGSYDLQPDLNFEKMGLIKGGSFFMEAKGTWGHGINDKVGALFNPNADIGGDYSIFVNKWWYKQTLLNKKIELRAGMLESKKDLFDVSPYAYHEDKDFMNVLSLRTPSVPHHTGIGAFLKLQPVDWLYFQAAAIDAEARPRRTGFDTAFHGRALYTGYWEAGLTPNFQTAKGPMPGKYYLGWWYDPLEKKVFDDKGQPEEFRSGDMGLYLGANQLIWKENCNPSDTQGLAFFSRGGFAKRDVKKVPYSWQAGVSYTGLIPTRDQDVTAFSVAQAILSECYRTHGHPYTNSETVYEWYYRVQLTPWCTLSPDIQYITNPGGEDGARDALVGGLRIRVTF